MFRDECTKDKFKLQYHNIEDFTRCFWQNDTQVYPVWLAYRAILCVYFDFAVLFLLIYTEDGYDWYKNGLYYTFWVYLAEMVAFTLALGLTVEKFIQDRKNPVPKPPEQPNVTPQTRPNPKDYPAPNPQSRPNAGPHTRPNANFPPPPRERHQLDLRDFHLMHLREIHALHPKAHHHLVNFHPTAREHHVQAPLPDVLTLRYKVFWCSYTVAATNAALVTTIYFLFVFTQEKQTGFTYMVIAHVLNTVCIVLDFFLCAIPIRFLHFYIPMIFVVIYTLFTGVYQGCGGTGENGQIPIYTMMDWREPNMVFSGLATELTCGALLHCGFCILGILKHWLKTVRESNTQV